MAKWIRALFAVAVSAWGFAASAQSLTQVGTFDWPSPSIMGLSGLEISDDGQTFFAVSDRGWFLSGTLQRTDARITGVTLLTHLPILDTDGWPVAARRTGDLADAEGLAMAPDGSYWISFERWARVVRYETPTSKGQQIEDHASFYDYADNRQLEALALAPDGRLYTFPEKPQATGFPIYRLDGEDWVIAGHIAQRDGFSIVGADFDDSGRLYLLERKLAFGLWWQNRLRRLDVQRPDTDEILWTSARGEFDNIEGIAVWTDPRGLRITMISDDNGDPDEPTQFVEFQLVE